MAEPSAAQVNMLRKAIAKRILQISEVALKKAKAGLDTSKERELVKKYYNDLARAEISFRTIYAKWWRAAGAVREAEYITARQLGQIYVVVKEVRSKLIKAKKTNPGSANIQNYLANFTTIARALVQAEKAVNDIIAVGTARGTKKHVAGLKKYIKEARNILYNVFVKNRNPSSVFFKIVGNSTMRNIDGAIILCDKILKEENMAESILRGAGKL
ncbi:MAG: hypothetical protein HY438_02665 [DPANN group archaeon]|nr:hypothetical protein [DPANN group archaeon]